MQNLIRITTMSIGSPLQLPHMATFEDIWPILVQRAKELEYVETFSHGNKNDVDYNPKRDSIRFHSRETKEENWKDIPRKHWKTAWEELRLTGELEPNQFLEVTNIWRSSAAVPFLQKALQLPMDSDSNRIKLPNEFSLETLHDVADFGSNQTPDFEERTPDLSPPKRVSTQVSRVVRNTTKAKKLKELYDHKCQVCGIQRQQKDEEPYAEVHHIQPLGSDPPGPDELENLLVLCPNHHADFDYGLIRVEPETHRIRHAYEPSVDGSELRVASEHPLSSVYLQFHIDEISQL